MKAIDVACEVCFAWIGFDCDVKGADPRDLVGKYHKKRVIASSKREREKNQVRKKAYLATGRYQEVRNRSADPDAQTSPSMGVYKRSVRLPSQPPS